MGQFQQGKLPFKQVGSLLAEVMSGLIMMRPLLARGSRNAAAYFWISLTMTPAWPYE